MELLTQGLLKSKPDSAHLKLLLPDQIIDPLLATFLLVSGPYGPKHVRERIVNHQREVQIPLNSNQSLFLMAKMSQIDPKHLNLFQKAMGLLQSQSLQKRENRG